MRNGKSVSDIRQANRALLLESLYFGGPASRKGLAHQTGLTAASLTQLTSQLIGEGVLIETEKRLPQNRTGRAEQLLDLNREELRAVGVVVTEAGMRINLTDLNLRLLKSELLPLNAETLTDGELLSAIEHVAGAERNNVTGIGVSVRGSVDPIRGVSVDSYGILPKDFPISEPLAAASGLMVTTDNNVRAMLTAHTLLHPKSASGVVLLIKYGPGVGGALMIAGRHFLGSRFTACEIGHICAEDGGIACVCGKRGCLETLLRFDTLEKQAAELFSETRTPVLYSLCGKKAENISAPLIYEAFSMGDKGLAEILEKPLAAFAVAVASAQALYDPDTILLCSEVFENEPVIRYLEAEIKGRSGSDAPRLRFISNRDELGAKSAAAIAVKAFLTKGAADFRRND